MVAGFEQPTAGLVLIDGEDVAGLPPHRRPDQHRLSELRAVPPSERRRERRLRAAAQEGRQGRDRAPGARASSSGSGSPTEINRRPNQLSGGSSSASRSRGRWSTCPRCCCSTSRSGALDLKLRKGLQIELKRIQREVGITFVYVTHDQEEALTMSDRIAVMNRGRIEQVDAPEEVYERPATTLRRRLHRRLQPDAGRGRPVPNGGARGCGSTPGSRSRPPPTGSARASACHAVVRPEKLGSAPRRRRRARRARASRERSRLGLPRHRDPDRRRARRATCG